MEQLDLTHLKNKGLLYTIVAAIAAVPLGLICGFCYYLATKATTQREVDEKLKIMKICAIIGVVLLSLGVVYFIVWLGMAGSMILRF